MGTKDDERTEDRDAFAARAKHEDRKNKLKIKRFIFKKKAIADEVDFDPSSGKANMANDNVNTEPYDQKGRWKEWEEQAQSLL